MIIRKKRRKKKKTRSRISPGILAVIGGLLLVIGGLLFLLLYRGREETTERGAAVFSIKAKNAVIIRDESVYLSSEYAFVDCLAEEGEQVQEEQLLARVYKLGYSDELMQSLLNSREAVYKAQMERIGSTKDTRLDELNERILELKGRIESSVMQGSGEDLEKLYRSLDKVLKERMEYLKGKVQETENLRALYSGVEDKEALIATWTEEVSCGSPGAVSYYFDGFEQAMNAEKLNMLTADLIKRALKDSGSSNWTTDDKTRVCRVVNRNKWYAAFLTGGEELTRLCEGVEYEVTFPGFGTYSGIALEPVVSGKEIVNVIEFDTDIGELIEVRSAKVDVTAAVSGIKVKDTAVIFDKGETYIELMINDSHLRIRVDVLGAEGGYVIVRPHESDDTLSEGVRYWNRKR